MTIIIVHGAFGSPKENWFQWLKKGLEKIDEFVFVPKFPTPESQSLDNWLNVLERFEEYFSSELIMVGHSLGCALILHQLQNLENPIRAVFLVAGFVGELGIEEFDKVNKSFFEKEFDWEKIRKNCRKFFVFASENDPYIELERQVELAKKLDANFILERGAGHFNERFGYKRFPRLLLEIKTLYDL